MSPIISFGFNNKKDDKSEQKEKYDKEFPALGNTSQSSILLNESAIKLRKAAHF